MILPTSSSSARPHDRMTCVKAMTLSASSCGTNCATNSSRKKYSSSSSVSATASNSSYKMETAFRCCKMATKSSILPLAPPFPDNEFKFRLKHETIEILIRGIDLEHVRQCPWYALSEKLYQITFRLSIIETLMYSTPIRKPRKTAHSRKNPLEKEPAYLHIRRILCMKFVLMESPLSPLSPLSPPKSSHPSPPSSMVPSGSPNCLLKSSQNNTSIIFLSISSTFSPNSVTAWTSTPTLLETPPQTLLTGAACCSGRWNNACSRPAMLEQTKPSFTISTKPYLAPVPTATSGFTAAPPEMSSSTGRPVASTNIPRSDSILTTKTF